MKLRKRVLVLCCLMCVVLCSVSHAGADASETEGSRFKVSFSERFRFVSWDNAVDLDASQDSRNTFTRHRTGLMVAWTPLSRLELGVKLTNEFRYYFVPEGRDFTLHEVFFDNLYVDWVRPGDLPLGLKLGRQNIMLGEGFVVMDGHPLDGSRSAYFNAVRMDVFLPQQNRLIVFYTYVPETDDLLPVLNDQDQPLLEQPEEGIGIYYSGQRANTGMEAYVIRKTIRRTEAHPVRSRINTLGGRMVYPLGRGFSLTGEGAYQFGDYGDADRTAWGGYFHLDYTLPRSLLFLQKVTGGGIYLSGDDPETEKVEGWDPVFSRWPKWSESYIYTLIQEYGGRVAYWSNLASVYGTLMFGITESMNLGVTYHRLLALEAADPGQDFPRGEGQTRGDLFIAKLVFDLSQNLRGHLLWERFLPGDYYGADAVSYDWFRCELMVTL